MNELNLYTNGGQFHLEGTTEEYVGYYNIVEENVYTERAFSKDSKRLVSIPLNNIIYGKPAPEDITIYVPEPTDNDYKTGWFIRYFARKANEPTARYHEIDKTQYGQITSGQKPLYTAVQLRWKISGPENDVLSGGKIIEPGVYDTNNRTLQQLTVKHGGLRNRLLNLLEFWKGRKEVTFGPPQSEDNSKLVLPIPDENTK